MSAIPETAEVAVLYSVLMDPPGLADVAGSLRPDDFGVQDHAAIYRAMLACHERKQRPDMVNVSNELTERGQDRLATEVYAIPGSVDAWIIPTHITDYAATVVTASRRRAVVAKATSLIAAVHNDPNADPVEAAHRMLADLADLSEADDGPVMYADVMAHVQERLTLQVAGAWEERLFRTGLADLDRKMDGGARGGELIYLAGRPGSGKTAMALQIMHNGARRTEPVLLFSGEMSMASLIDRGLSEVSGLPLGAIRKRVLPRDQYDALMRASERMIGMPVGIDATAGITTGQMLIRAQRFQRRHGLSAVFFDYIELAGDQAGKDNETQRLGVISRSLKRMAIALDVPVFVLSQLNRQVESRNPPVPRMSDLRQSGALEQDADMVCLIYRHDYYVGQGVVQFDATKQGIADIIIGKHRNGATGTVNVRFDETTMRFQNLDTASERGVA